MYVSLSAYIFLYSDLHDSVLFFGIEKKRADRTCCKATVRRWVSIARRRPFAHMSHDDDGTGPHGIKELGDAYHADVKNANKYTQHIRNHIAQNTIDERRSVQLALQQYRDAQRQFYQRKQDLLQSDAMRANKQGLDSATRSMEQSLRKIARYVESQDALLRKIHGDDITTYLQKKQQLLLKTKLDFFDGADTADRNPASWLLFDNYLYQKTMDDIPLISLPNGMLM